MAFDIEIKKLGLSDKETAVYLAALELGATPVQPIAKKAKVARATTYLVLESLMHRGLVNHYKEGKKTLFKAEPPQKLLDYVAEEERLLHQRRASLEEIIPRLHALMQSMEDKPNVEYFEGIDGLRTMRQLMLRNSEFGDTWYNFAPVDALIKVFGEKESLYYNQRRAKGIQSYAIITTGSEKVKKRELADAKKHRSNRKFAPLEQFSSTSAITVFGDNVSIGKLEGKIGGMIIESPQIALFLREALAYIWETLP